MIEVDFKDRIPTHAGRIKLTPVSGQPDLFTMERADEPKEPGTPLDKAAFDSIIKSRLTGRYYLPTVTGKIISSQIGIAANPIPASSWVYRPGGVIGYSENWGVECSSVFGAGYNPGNIFDGSDATQWKSAVELVSWVAFSTGPAFKIKKFKTNIADHGLFSTLQAQGSNDGSTWDTLAGLSAGNHEYTITNPKEYKFYRLYFRSSSAVNTIIYDWQITEYDVTTIQNEYVIDAFPVDVTDHQRFTIVVPEVNTIGVTRNTLNGRNIDIILQPNKRYELVSSWDGNFYGREL